MPAGSLRTAAETPFRAKEGRGIEMEMLVREQNQDGVALLLDPAGRRSLISPFGGAESAGCA